MSGLSELKVKESNRLLMIAQNLEKCGVTLKMGVEKILENGVEINDDFLEVQGGISQPRMQVEIATAMDHRIAMSFLIMGLSLENGLRIDDGAMIKTSFPTFTEIFKSCGYDFSIN